MRRPRKLEVSVAAAILAVLLAACSSKVAKVGGESHFACESSDDCPPAVPKCVRATGAVRGECHAVSQSLGAPARSPVENGTGGVNNGGAAAVSAGTASSGSGDPPCTVACCPANSACYATDKGPASSGAACLATQDNTGQDHIQLRQTWVRPMAPAGLTTPIVYNVQVMRSELPLDGKMGTPDCKTAGGSLGAGGYIELVDLHGDTARIGFARKVSRATVGAALTDGLCMGSTVYGGDPSYRLDSSAIAAPGPWPVGLRAPMGLKDSTWVVAPTVAKRLETDFDLNVSRGDLLVKLVASEGEYGKDGFNAVFFYDAATGYLHTYAPLSWQVKYDANQTSFIPVPMREVEKKSTFNDPSHPNCVGVYGADPIMTLAGGCRASSDPNMGTAWGGGNCTHSMGNATCKAGETGATMEGYALISELEQVFDLDLGDQGLTLCVAYAGQQAASDDGFFDPVTRGCRTAKWDPTEQSGDGLPYGDWCASTNSSATASCHDAFRVRAFQTFSGAKIQLDAMSGAPATCSF